MQIERRKLIRLPMNESFWLRDQKNQEYQVSGRDITQKAVAAVGSVELTENDTIDVLFSADFKIRGRVLRIGPDEEELTVVISFEDLNEAESDDLEKYLIEIQIKEYQLVDFDGFKFLIYCIALDGIEEEEISLLSRWIEMSKYPPELSEILWDRIRQPPSISVMYQKVKEYLLLQNLDSEYQDALWHNLEVLICADGIISLHEKLILQTIIEIVPGVFDRLSEVFHNASVLLSIRHYLDIKQSTTARLKDHYREKTGDAWMLDDREIWAFFLIARLGEFIVPESNKPAYPALLSQFLTPYYAITEEVLVSLVQESISISDSLSEDELLDEFLVGADPDQRNMLIEICQQLMISRKGIPAAGIDLFAELVKGRGEIIEASEKQGLIEQNRIIIGCGDQADLKLPIAFDQADALTIRFSGAEYEITSSDGCFFIYGNGYRSFKGAHEFIAFRFMDFRFFLFPAQQRVFCEQNPERYLSISDYSVFVPDNTSWNPFLNRRKTILQNLNVVFRTGEFIGIFGPTGSGKSTLLTSLLNRFETEGNVWIDGKPYNDYYQKNFHEVGFVPQDDVLHRDLTVFETLYYSISLRGIARDIEQIRGLIDQTIRQLDLERASGIIIGDEQKKGVSGGQRKRVNLALELLSENIYLLMLDEPTSGLDPATELQIHQLLRNLASQGLIILMVSHSLYEATLALLDMALILTSQGEIAYWGPALESREYFRVETPQEIFNVLKQQPSDYWAEKYRSESNPFHRKYTINRQLLTQSRPVEEQLEQSTVPDADVAPAAISSADDIRRKRPLQQFLVSTRRLVKRQMRDRQSLISRGLQAVLLAIVMRIAYLSPESGLLTLLSIVPVWLGATMSVRAINSDLPVFLRERRYQLGILPYILSIFLVNAFFIFFQVFIFLGVLYLIIPLGAFGFSFLNVLLILYFTSLVGLCLGMLLSAVFSSQQAAVNALPLFLVFMILFGGSVIQLKDMSSVAYWISNTTPTRWAIEGLIYEGKCMATGIPQGTRWEICGVTDKGLQQQLKSNKVYPVEIKSPDWGDRPVSSLFDVEKPPPKVGKGLLLMGLYRQPMKECSFDNFDTCPASLMPQRLIMPIMWLQILLILGLCVGIMLFKTRKHL